MLSLLLLLLFLGAAAHGGVCRPATEVATRPGVDFVATLCQVNEELGWSSVTLSLRTRKAQLKYRHQTLSDDPSWDSLARSLGPHSLLALLTGTEMHFQVNPELQEDEESLTYTFRLSTGLNGEYNLTVVMFGKDYVSLEEHTKGPRKNFQAGVFSAQLLVTEARDFEDVVPRQLDAPPCQPGEDLSGRWVFGDFTKGRVWSHRCMPACLSTIGRRYLDGGRWLQGSPDSPARGVQWVPHTCSVHHFTLAEAQACLWGKHVEFAGDSHSRKMTTKLLEDFIGFKPLKGSYEEIKFDWAAIAENCPKVCYHEDAVEGVPGTRAVVRHPLISLYSPDGRTMNITYLRSRFNAPPIESDLSFISFNFAHWNFGVGQIKVSEYMSLVRSEFERVVREASPGQRLYWVDITPGFLWGKSLSKGWGSFQRLYTVNQMVAEVAREFPRITHIKSFPLFGGMLGTRDMHFNTFQLNSLINSLLNDFCRPPGEPSQGPEDSAKGAEQP